MKNILMFFIACIASGLLFSACEMDNYDAPDGGIRGTLYDALTGLPYISEQPNGFRISSSILTWQGAESASGQAFWGKADGTFNNDKIFAGTYRVYPGSGGFYGVKQDTVVINSNQMTEHDFYVTPYVSFRDVSIVEDPNAPGTVVATFTIHANVEMAYDPVQGIDTVKTKATIRDYQFFASKRTAKVGVNAYDDDVSNVPKTLTTADLDVPIVVRKTGFKAGTTYYIRIGARCTESPDARYNMTEIFKIEI